MIRAELHGTAFATALLGALMPSVLSFGATLLF